MTPWEIKGTQFGSCNCDWGCPCQFNALPTHGNCEALVGAEISEGHFGDTSLDGLRVATVMWWPGPVHEGGGKVLLVVDERADDAQREALQTIFSGGETEPGATVFNVFAATFEEIFDPVYKPIELSIDVDARTGHLKVEGVGESRGQPIRNPVTGEEHRARINLPDGFEYTVAEMGDATFSTSGPIELSNENCYAEFNQLHMNNQGVVRDQAA